MKAFTYHLYLEFKSMLKDSSLLLASYIFPLAFFFIIALLFPSIIPGYEKNLLPGMLTFILMANPLLNLPSIIVSNREKEIYRSYKIYNVNLKSILLMPAITLSLHTIIVGILVTVVSIVFFNCPFPTSYIKLILYFFIGLLVFCGLGTLIGVCSKTSRMALLVGQLFFLPSMILSGVTMPKNVLPQNIITFSNILPATPIDTLMTNIYTAAFSGTECVLMITLAISVFVSFILSAILFVWDNKTFNQRIIFIGLTFFIPFIYLIYYFS